ncbi:MAG TPA: haloacid dehalogenase type II [Acetobacteraceae bacterium]|nr:haloacid dehalogenase type II [Acetobacteraceae bacterium]
MIRAAIFDAYGTLLDPVAPVERHAARVGHQWREFARLWRQKQLEYSWVRSMVGPGAHRDFNRLTREALGFAASSLGIIDQDLLDTLERAWRDLPAYPEVTEALNQLRLAGIARAVLSNGEPRMLAEQIRNARLTALLDDVLSVEAVGVFKPDPRVYRLAVDRFGLRPAEIAFISANPWDVFGAHAFGCRAIHLNRLMVPDEYGLADSVRTLPDLTRLSDLLA